MRNVAIISSSALFALFVTAMMANAADNAQDAGIYARDNLIAWCIVPFDAKRRTPEERAAMLARLGFKHFAYDYRAEHVPTFEVEIAACKQQGVSLDAWWFPSSLNADARRILNVCRQADIHPQLWVSGGGEPTNNPAEQQARVEQEAARIRPIVEAAAAQGLKVGLYNHGGWFGEPENQLAIIRRLNLPNVGMVYNLHHGHAHVDRLSQILRECLPHLLAVNLNGMTRAGDQYGQKILQLGQGELDLALLRTIRDSGYRGPIGILGHTQDDAEARLQDNLDGLDWLVPQLDGQAAGPQPKPRTAVPAARKPATATTKEAWGYLIEGRDAYRAVPFTVRLRATLVDKTGYNILAACDPKSSAAHWELFTQPKSGLLAAYLPGLKPDHVWTNIDLCDGQTHEVVLHREAGRVRLLVDGRLAGEEQAAPAAGRLAVAGPLAVGRLADGSLGCTGVIHELQVSRGAASPAAAEDIVGWWKFADPNAEQSADLSPGKNSARRAAEEVARNAAPFPSPGMHLKPVDAKFAGTLIDRTADRVYLGVRVDRDGHVFVGGREGVFVFEAQANGAYGSRRELLRFPTDSIIIGLEFRGDDLYVLTSDALYLVPRGRVDRTDLQPQRILWGIPLDLHVSFHCLAWGPDGDLYVTHGDPLLQYGDWQRPDHWGHWTLYCGVENKPLPYTGQGAVLRMNPDGTNVRVVARGLRGPVGLAFDDAGNLFTNDNDHEGRADLYAPARLLHVLEGVDFAWPRGWMASKSPDRFDLLDTVNNDLGRGVPCDMAFAADGRLLMCRWDCFAVTSYRMRPRGVSFEAEEETVFTGDENCRPVGIATHGDRVFVTSLYMTGNQAAPYCASELMVFQSRAGDVAQQADDSPAPAPAAQSSSALDDARSDDTYRRQLGVARLAREWDHPQFAEHFASSDEPTRLAAVLAAQRQLTVPEPHFVPPSELALHYPKESAFFKRLQPFYGTSAKTDLAALGRIGSFTIAEWWATVKHTPEQEAIFALLSRSLDDSSERIQLQAAYALGLLRDPRSEPLIERARRDVLLKRLVAAEETILQRAWTTGPLGGPDSPEERPLDLSAEYETPAGPLGWKEATAAQGHFALRSKPAGAVYLHFRVQSVARQFSLLALRGYGTNPAAWVNGSATEILPSAAAEERRWIIDLQPGGNDVLLRLNGKDEAPPPTLDVALRSAGRVEMELPEKLDSALLAARLREAATGPQPLDPAFLATDWSMAAKSGDAAEGRRLFGALGCAKCHAIVPDQRSGGAPSLFEARRRFAATHLVESIVLPSRQIAEPFRGQSFVMNDGRILTGLVVSESGESVELLLPDASRRTILKKQIEQREASPLSPMPQGLVKTPDELRHLLVYLLSDRPTPP